VGPDNYRLEYGRYIGAARWDTHVYSNNLGLEILTGSGVLGLAAFISLIIVIPWRFDADSISIGIFLFHGMVDVFLMTTPIYFAFWLLLGSHADGQTIGRFPV
jgi:O-antigen ligase